MAKVSFHNPIPIMPLAIAATAIALFGVAGYLYYDAFVVPRCLACEMKVTPEMQEQHRVYVLPGGERVWSCCPMCNLRIAAVHPDLRIETWCDNCRKPITIEVEGREVVEVDPGGTIVLAGAAVTKSCLDNRFACSPECRDALLPGLPEDTPTPPPAKAIEKALEIGVVPPPSPALPIGLAVVGIVFLIISCVAAKRLRE